MWTVVGSPPLRHLRETNAPKLETVERACLDPGHYRPLLSIAALMDLPIASATGGGRAFPTWRYAAVLRPANCHSSGNAWRRATIRVVSRGSVSRSASLEGARSAMPMPSIPRVRHWARALVGPRSGPPCLDDPPTIVGAGPLARRAQSCAPSQPREPIRSRKVAPTCGGPLVAGSGHRRWAAYREATATRMNRGRS